MDGLCEFGDTTWLGLSEQSRLVKSSAVLAHFKEKLMVILACNASPYRVGVVLGHQLPAGCEVPVSSTEQNSSLLLQTLSSTEQNYVQISKEARNH